MAKPNWAPHHAVSKALPSVSSGADFGGGLGELCGRRTWIRVSTTKIGILSPSRRVGGETLGLKTSATAPAKIRSMLANLGDSCTPIVSLQAVRCQCVRAVGLSVSRSDSMFRVESQLRAAGLRDGALEGSGEGWCGLCGDRRGWCTCGRCMGEGGFPTRPGLAGVKGKVGWARCKTCFGQKVVPCLLCGISEAPTAKSRAVGDLKFWCTIRK